MFADEYLLLGDGLEFGLKGENSKDILLRLFREDERELMSLEVTHVVILFVLICELDGKEELCNDSVLDLEVHVDGVDLDQVVQQ